MPPGRVRRTNACPGSNYFGPLYLIRLSLRASACYRAAPGVWTVLNCVWCLRCERRRIGPHIRKGRDLIELVP